MFGCRRRRFKDANRLQQVLGPTSEFHRAYDVARLKAYVREAELLMHTFLDGTAAKWAEDMQIAIRGIVEVRKVPPKPVPKPELCVEDDIEFPLAGAD